MSNRPRTPQFFPRMKVRGERRRRVAPWQKLAGAAGIAAAAFDEFAAAVRKFES